MKQKEFVLNYMVAFGPISPLKAQSEFGVWRLAAVIHRLRKDGYRVLTVPRRTFNGRRFVEYRLI